jgi:hypothetical protein
MFKWFKKKQSLGLKPLLHDERDFHVKTLGWSWTLDNQYKPKANRRVLNTFGIRNQRGLNTCVVESGEVAKEPQENVVLSASFMASYLKKIGIMDENGTDLRSFQKALVDVGCAEESVCPSDHTLSWDKFSNQSNLNPNAMANASKHKAQSFWKATTRDEIMKGIDEGFIFHTGMMWYSGYNYLKLPFKIKLFDGTVVGGHAWDIIGYDLNYQNLGECFICQNSFGESWGDKGKFYISSFELLPQIKNWGGYFTLDIPKELGRWLQDNQGKIIKNESGVTPEEKSKLYILQGKEKRWIPDEATFSSWGFDGVSTIIDNEGYLRQISEGIPLDFWSGKNVLIIKQIIQQRSNLKPLFKKYFNELFV